MSNPTSPNPDQDDAALQQQLNDLIAEEEGTQSQFGGWWGVFITLACVFMSLVHLYAAYDIVPTSTMRPLHVSMVLAMTFLIMPISKRYVNRIMWWDLIAAGLAIAVFFVIVTGGEDFLERNTNPIQTDIAWGVILILLILEALRRTNGWILLVITGAFLAYALFGNYLPEPWTHKGYSVGRLIGHMYMTLEGIYGSAVDVSSTLIILFTIFGAFLQYTGAGKFFID